MIPFKFLPGIVIGLVSLIFLLTRHIVFAAVFAAVTGLFYADFLRRGAHFSSPGDGEEDEIPAGDATEADYRLLGITPESSLSEVKRVYKYLASQFHPDTGAPLTEEQRRTAEEAFLKIREAHDRIIKSRQRD